MQTILSWSNCDIIMSPVTLKIVKFTRIGSPDCLVPIMYPCEFDFNPSTGSGDVVMTSIFGHCNVSCDLENKF